MIYKLDHIAYRVNNIEAYLPLLAEHGYTISFFYKNIAPVAAVCKSSNSQFTSYDEALFTRKGNYGLQLVSLNNPSPGSQEPDPPLNDLLSRQNTGPLPIHCDNLDRSLAFWRLLGFTTSEMADTLPCTLSKALFGSTQAVILSPASGDLRSGGFDCPLSHLSFFSTDIRADWQAFQDYHPTNICRLDFAHQSYELFFMSSPEASLIEVVGKTVGAATLPAASSS